MGEMKRFPYIFSYCAENGKSDIFGHIAFCYITHTYSVVKSGKLF